MIEVTLTLSEVMSAAVIGISRQLQSMKMNLTNQHGTEGNDWQIHIEGALGECAAAKAIDRYWPATVGTFKMGGDVGMIQVRTRSRHDYELIIRKNDDMDASFVLVTGTAPTYRVWGWHNAGDARKDEWLRSHGGRPPAWFVPHEALRPLGELP